MLSKEKINKVIDILSVTYNDATIQLNFDTPFELLVATILSAQCTDVRVNIVTKELFQHGNTPESILSLGEKKLKDIIKSCGLSNNKSKNIISTCKILINQYNCKVPNTREELIKLPGVGRKTANVVISNAFNKPAIAVDTHVLRVSNRIGLANSKNVLETEKQLMNNIPKELWLEAHHWLIHHGRNICFARSPKCNFCPINMYCNYFNEEEYNL